MASRACDNCGSRMAPFFPRSRSADGNSLLCNNCKGLETQGMILPEGGINKQATTDEQLYIDMVNAIADYLYAVSDTDEKVESTVEAITDIIDHAQLPGHVSSLHKTAHDSGDGETIYHCPFCGAGGVMGRSDGTAECQFCGTAFTVQVQPKMPSMPQTIDGTPYDNPDMPGSVSEPGQPEPGFGEEEGQEMGLPDAAGEDVPNPNPFSGAPPKAKPNPFAAILRPRFTTRQGARLSEEDYMKHLALKHAEDREAVLQTMRRRDGR